MAEDKYGENNLRGIARRLLRSGKRPEKFADRNETLDQIAIISRLQEPLESDEVARIIRAHGDSKSIPMRLSASMAAYPAPLDEEGLAQCVQNEIPGVIELRESRIAFTEATIEAADKALNHPDLMRWIQNPSLVPKSDRHVRGALQKYEEVGFILRKGWRTIQELHPELSELDFHDESPLVLQRGLDIVREHKLEMGSEAEAGIVSITKDVIALLASSVIKTTDPATIDKLYGLQREIERREDECLSSLAASQGYRPDALLECAKQQLDIRHSIDTEALEQGYVGICNGTSSMLMASAIGAQISPGQVILTPELHWDGYEYIAESCEATLDEMPRPIQIEEYLKKQYVATFSMKSAAEQIKEKVGCILITHPCSILGKDYTESELAQLVSVAKKYEIPLIVNEIYASPNHQNEDHPSITKVPGFEDISQRVVITGSTSKTVHNTSKHAPKLSYFWTANQELGHRIEEEKQQYEQRSFDREDVITISAYLKNASRDYLVENEKRSEERREHIDSLIDKVQEKMGCKAVSWHSDRPDKGYTSTLKVDDALLKKAEIKTPKELFEYVFKMAHVATGPIFPVARGGKPGTLGMRVNYSVDIERLDLAFALLEHAVGEMQKGVTYSQMMEKCQSVPKGMGLPGLLSGGFISFGGNNGFREF